MSRPKGDAFPNFETTQEYAIDRATLCTARTWVMSGRGRQWAWSIDDEFGKRLATGESTGRKGARQQARAWLRKQVAAGKIAKVA